MSTQLQVFVGFGGSGGHILTALAQRLSEDFTWADLADRHTYFLVVDTHTDDLKESHEAIKNALSREGGQAWVGRLGLADGVDSIAHLVTHQLAPNKQPDPAGQKLLQDHWWYRDNLPFVARSFLGSPQDGAGQCPPISRFLAWLAAGKLGTVINELVNSMRNRMEGRPFSVDLVLTGSLAGGTGRGCWSLLSLRIRQLLAAEGILCHPFGYFLDQGCFHNVKANHPKQEYKLKINALTGLSELVMWLRNDHDGRPALYRLPALEQPERPELAVIDADKCRMGVAPARGASPLDAAFLVFENSASGRPESDGDYCQMLSTCLYARTVNPEVGAVQVNDTRVLSGIGSASFEIPATSLREYLTERARLALLERLIQPSPDPDRDAQVARILDPLRLDAVSLAKLTPDENGSLAERIVHHLRALAPVVGFKAALEGDNKEDALRCAQTLETPDPARVEQAIIAATGAATGAANPVTYLRRELLDLVGGTLGRHSISQALAVLRQLREQLLLQVRTLPAQPETPEDQRSLVARTEEASKRSWLGWKFPHFTPAEQQQLEGAARNRFVVANFDEIARNLRADYDELAALVQRYLEILTRVETVFTARALDRQQATRDLATVLFTRPERLEDSVPGMYSATRYVRRVLKPLFDESSLLTKIHALLDGRSLAADALGTLYGTIRQALETHENRPSLPLADLDRVRTRVDADLTTALDRVNIPKEFVRDHFNFARVVEGLMAAWSQGITLAQGPDRGRLSRLFEQFFGIQVQPWTDTDDRMRAPDVPAAVTAMGASLAATCDPFFVKRPNTGLRAPDRVVLFLPCLPEFNADFALKLKESPAAKARDLGAGFSVIATAVPRATSDDRPGRNPFCMVTFASEAFPDLHDSQDFGGVESVNYWQTDPRLPDWLELTERADGESVFCDRDDNVGIGHVDPAFVRQKPWTDLRWKPWAAARTNQLEQAARRQHLAVAYAMLGNRVSDAPAAAADPALLARIATTKGWQLPLLERTPDNRWRWTRRAYQLELGRVEARGDAWEADDTYSSLNQLRRALDGLAGPAIIGELEAELALFEKDVLSDPALEVTPAEHRALVKHLLDFLDAEKTRIGKSVRDPGQQQSMLTFIEALSNAAKLWTPQS